MINFRIAGSKSVDDQITEISPDIAVCEECLAEYGIRSGKDRLSFY